MLIAVFLSPVIMTGEGCLDTINILIVCLDIFSLAKDMPTNFSFR